MNLLINKLPTEVEGIKINTDYKISILFELLMQDIKVPKELKLMKALQMYYPEFNKIKSYEKAIQDMMWFYKCGKQIESTNKGVSSNSKYNLIYSFEYDDKYIYSAFLQQYNIDLQDENLHWWKFKALFDGLSKDTKIVEIMGYRAIDLRTIKDKEERKRIKKLKDLYKLPDMRTKEQKEADFGRAFL